MQAIVLVGGEGTRLRPLTYVTPKPMVPLMNVPFLARTVERLYEAGIRDVIFPACYLPEAITDYFGNGSRFGMRFVYVIEETPLGTAGALKNVERYVDGPFFVLNGDILTSLDLRAMYRYHRERGGIGTLHLVRVDDPSAFGCVVHDESGRITAFVEKPPRGTEPTNEINAGTYLLEPEVLDAIPAGRPVSIERETFPALIASGRPLYAYTTDDYWMDLGRPEQYLAAHRDILSGALSLRIEPGLTGPGASGLPQGVEVVPPIHVDESVQVEAGARLGPNAVIGPRCRIGTNAVVRESVLWDEVIVEPGARLDEVIVASRARIGAGAVLGAGCVVGHDAVIAPGSVLPPGSKVAPETAAPVG